MFEFTKREPEGIIRRLPLHYISLITNESKSFEQTIYRTGYFRQVQKFYRVLREVDSRGKIIFPSWNEEMKEFFIQSVGYTLHLRNRTYGHSLSFQEFERRGRPIFIDEGF